MSNSRALRRRVGSQRVIPVPDACCALELIVNPAGLETRHDADCPALHPATAAGLTARARANAALDDVISGLGYSRNLTAIVWD